MKKQIKFNKNAEQVLAKVIEHTRHNETELITVEIDLHRFIIAQVNTHRTLSRGYQSSRAMPILKQLKQVEENPALPVHYGSAGKGMVAGEELSQAKQDVAEVIILEMRDFCLEKVKGLQKLGVSKEITNRYLEPWMMTKGIITATKEAWEGFFKLRCEYDAQPEIQVLANNIKKAIEDSSPRILVEGDWHLPYIEVVKDEYNITRYYIEGKTVTLKEAIRASTAACAQVSYRTLSLDPTKVNNVYSMLKLPENGVYPEEAPHYSASEHASVATCIYKDCITDCSGNLNTKDYYQYRKMLEKGVERVFM